MTVVAVGVRSAVLEVRIEQSPERLGELLDVLAALKAQYQVLWRLTSALGVVYRSGTPSPAMDPVPKSAPDLRVQRVAQGSLLIDLFEDPSTLALGGSMLGGGALWMLWRVIRRSPQAVASLVADLSTLPEFFETRRAENRADLYRSQQAEIDARLELMDARLREWYATEGAPELWTQYQRLLNGARGPVAVRMLDENGDELEEPDVP